MMDQAEVKIRADQIAEVATQGVDKGIISLMIVGLVAQAEIDMLRP